MINDHRLITEFYQKKIDKILDENNQLIDMMIKEIEIVKENADFYKKQNKVYGFFLVVQSLIMIFISFFR